MCEEYKEPEKVYIYRERWMSRWGKRKVGGNELNSKGRMKEEQWALNGD